jgi:predicted enzyme related to lactoylglutathione lyase
MTKPTLMVVNHIGLEVDDVDAALEFYGQVFDSQLRGSQRSMAVSCWWLSSTWGTNSWH